MMPKRNGIKTDLMRVPKSFKKAIFELKERKERPATEILEEIGKKLRWHDYENFLDQITLFKSGRNKD